MKPEKNVFKRFELDEDQEVFIGGFDVDDDDDEIQESMEDYLDDFQTIKSVEPGTLVKGHIIKIADNEVYVDISHKTEGTVNLNEFDPEDDPAEVGREIEVLVVKMEENDGSIILSKNKAKLIKAWDEADDAFQGDGIIIAKVVAKVKGGLQASFNGLKAFVPGSLMSLQQEYDLEKYIGQKFDFKIIEFNRRRRNMVLSRKAILEKERKAAVVEILQRLEPGQIVDGVVKNITDYGAFVSIEGGKIDGLLHKADMSWAHVRDIRKLLNIGDEIKVRVLNVDRENEKISLGLKQLKADPWETIDERFKVGEAVNGFVKNITHFGAFVEIEEGIEGLVHISDMSWTERIRHPKELLQIDDEIEVKILNIDPEERKVALGMKQVHPDPWSLVRENYQVGEVVNGMVKNLADFGAFVELSEGVEGLIHISDLSWVGRVRHPSEVLQVGDMVDVKILDLDPDNKKISLGLKQVNPDPWELSDDNYPIGTIVHGRVKRLTDFGAFVELGDGIEGLIHVSDFSWTERVENPGDFLKEDQEIDVKVIDIDKDSRKISLGLKQLEEEPWEGVEEKFPVGTVTKGTVTKLTLFGAFVQLERGVEGLVHISDLSWTKRINHPSEAVSEGEEVEVKVLNINREERKISLGIKQLDSDPLAKFMTAHPVGSVTNGEVTSTTDFGAFVKLGDDLEGLVHASQIPGQGKPEELLKIGDTVKVKVLDVDKRDRRIRLSIKQAEAAEARIAAEKVTREAESATNVSIGDMLSDELKEQMAKIVESSDN